MLYTCTHEYMLTYSYICMCIRCSYVYRMCVLSERERGGERERESARASRLLTHRAKKERVSVQCMCVCVSAWSEYSQYIVLCWCVVLEETLVAPHRLKHIIPHPTHAFGVAATARAIVQS